MLQRGDGKHKHELGGGDYGVRRSVKLNQKKIDQIERAKNNKKPKVHSLSEAKHELLEIKVLHIRTCKAQITRRTFPLSSRDSRVYALSAES